MPGRTRYRMLCGSATVLPTWPKEKTDHDCRVQCAYNCVSLAHNTSGIYTHANIVDCMSDPALLGCETKVQVEEPLLLDDVGWLEAQHWPGCLGASLFQQAEYTQYFTRLNLSQARFTDWYTLTHLRFAVNQHPDVVLASACYREPAQILLRLTDETTGVEVCDTIVFYGTLDSTNSYLYTVPDVVLHNLTIAFEEAKKGHAVNPDETSAEYPPALLDLGFSFPVSCATGAAEKEAVAFSLEPTQYHTPSRCMGFVDCKSCLAASCNWCEWSSCDENCDSLPSWIPDYSWVESAYEANGGRCGVHPYVCRETVGAFNACKAARYNESSDYVWPITLLVISSVTVYTLFRIKNLRWWRSNAKWE